MRNSLRVAAAQINSTGSIAANVEKVADYAAQAARRRADALLFPECTVTGYHTDFRNIDPAEIRTALREISEIAAQCRIHLLIGTPLLLKDKLFNCLVVFDRSGTPVHAYAKCQLTVSDRKVFTPGNAVSLFEIDGFPATAIICHERRYPELVRIAAMAGARIVFHPNAGLDSLAVSRKKRDGRDGIPARAFENAIYYVFANTVGRQGGGFWSAGDTKIVAPDESVPALADNERESIVAATLDLKKATRKYPLDSFAHPEFLSTDWRKIVRKAEVQAQRESCRLLKAIS